MAAIYQKVTGEKCVILGQREALIYPFSIPDWTCIRVGYAISFTSTANPNGTVTNETLYFNDPKNGAYVGIKDTGLFIPFQTGCNFIGFSPHTAIDQAQTTNAWNDGSQYGYARSSNVGQNYPVVMQDRNVGYAGSDIRESMKGTNPTNMVGSTSYGRICGFEVSITGRNTIGQRASVRACAASDANGTLAFAANDIRVFLTNFLNPSQAATAYFTTGLSITGGPLPIPEAFFFYTPFFNNTVRIHNVYVERVSGQGQ